MFGIPLLTLLKYGLPVLAVLGLVVGAVLYIGHVRKDGEAAGALKVEHQVQQNTINIQRDINRAENSGPRTPRDVSKRLRDGTF
jgi:hypothetical protein